MKNLKGYLGSKVEGNNVNNLRYADDTVCISEYKENLQQLYDIVEEESRKKSWYSIKKK